MRKYNKADVVIILKRLIYLVVERKRKKEMVPSLLYALQIRILYAQLNLLLSWSKLEESICELSPKCSGSETVQRTW